MYREKEQEFRISLAQARKITKAIKYDDTVREIVVQIEMLAEKLPGIDMQDLKWKIDEVREAMNALESAVYGLEEPFEEALRNASYDEDDEDMREGADNDLFNMLAKSFEKEFGAPMSDPNKNRKPETDNDKDKDKDKKKIKNESLAVNLTKKQTSHILEAIMSTSEKCPECGGELVSENLMNEKKDACYRKVKSRYKVWPSAYASGALVQCRKKGASNWGNKKK